MLSNADMKPLRFLTMHKARKRVAWIKAQFASGKDVYISTYLKSTRYRPKHADMFRAGKTGAYVQRGKNWDCIDFCNLTAS